MAFRYGPGPILDAFPGAQAAYGLRLLRSTYTGSCLTVRRSSDNATRNIGFYRYTVDTQAILDFVGSGNGFVTTWFDQSTNGVNVSQGTAASQFNIVTSGSLHYEGNDLVMNAATDRAFLRGTNSVALTNWTVYIKSKMFRPPAQTYGTYVGNGSADGLIMHTGAGGFIYRTATYNSIGSPTTAYVKLQAKRNSTTTNIRGYQNGVNTGNTNIGQSLGLGTGVKIFGDFAGGGYTGTIRECLIYPVEHDDFTIAQINNTM
jgi:hypothetical protein